MSSEATVVILLDISIIYCILSVMCLLDLQDIASKIMAFSQQGPRTICILSANGAICNVTLRQPAMSGGTVTYEVHSIFYVIHLTECG